MNQIPGRSEAQIEIERDYAESRNQLGKDNEVLVGMGIPFRTNRVKNTNKIRFLAGKANMAVTQGKSLGNRDNRCCCQLLFPEGQRQTNPGTFYR